LKALRAAAPVALLALLVAAARLAGAPRVESSLAQLGPLRFVEILRDVALPSLAVALAAALAAWAAGADGNRPGWIPGVLLAVEAVAGVLASPCPVLPLQAIRILSYGRSASELAEMAPRAPYLDAALYARALSRAESDPRIDAAGYRRLLRLYRAAGGDDFLAAAALVDLGEGRARAGAARLWSRSPNGLEARLYLAAGEAARARATIARVHPAMRRYFEAVLALSGGRLDEARAILREMSRPGAGGDPVARAGLWCAAGEPDEARRILATESSRVWIGRHLVGMARSAPATPLAVHVFVTASARIALALKCEDPVRAGEIWARARRVCAESGLPHLIDFFAPLWNVPAPTSSRASPPSGSKSGDAGRARRGRGRA
jgi:hypothetical protein